MRRSKLRILLIAMLVAVLGAFPLLAPTPHRIDQEHFELLKEGMTRAEVKAIFGVPAGKYDWAEADWRAIWLDLGYFRASNAQPKVSWTELGVAAEDIAALVGLPLPAEQWVSRHGSFTVHFDGGGRLDWRYSSGSRIEPPWQRWWSAIGQR
jgi:hypothetical protein